MKIENEKPVKEKTPVNSDFLEKMFTCFRNGLPNSSPALEYLGSRALEYKKMETGYNSGQFHHGERRNETLITQCLEAGLLIDRGQKSSTGEKAYSVFGNKSLVFPLKDKQNRTVSFYFRSIVNNDNQKHYYLKNRQGLYPGYPPENTKILILTESIIDAATLLQSMESINPVNLENPINHGSDILACYGTNGLTGEHLEAIRDLPDLQEIVFAFDMDETGKAAVEKYAQTLSTLNCQLSTLDLPCKDVNETLIAHNPEIFPHLFNERKPITFLFSTETSNEKEKEEEPVKEEKANILNTQNPDCLTYETDTLRFTLWGGIDTVNINRLRATLHIRLKENEYRSFRDTVDLYSHTGTERLTRQASEKLEISTTLLSEAITALTAELETYRGQKREEYRKKEETREVSGKDFFTKEQMQAASTFLNNRQLNKLTYELFDNLGMVGEQDNAMLLFFIFLTRLFNKPLHAIVMGSSGSGKTHLLQGVAGTIPKQHIHYTTSLSENTLYYTPKDFLKHKVLLQEDLDGAYNALLPLRELMSNQSISRFSTKTNSRTGESKQVYLQVEGPVCIAGATTKERIYEDNANRSFLIQIEENPRHEREILEYQGKIAAGQINTKHYEKNINLLKAAQLQLYPMEVVIPFAESLDLPPHVFKKLRTKSHYLTLVKVLTLWNQRNRKKSEDEEGNPCLLSEVDDVRWANHLCRESLLRKSDELNGKTRNFFESLKESQTMDNKQNPLFRAVEIRSRFRLHPMQLKRYLDELESRGLIRCKSRSQKTGNEYEILVWNDYEVLLSGLDILQSIIEKLEKR